MGGGTDTAWVLYIYSIYTRTFVLLFINIADFYATYLGLFLENVKMGTWPDTGNHIAYVYLHYFVLLRNFT